MLESVKGTKTKFYTDVKTSIKAGMPYGSKDYKIRVVGQRTIRLYYDSIEKDCQVGSVLLKIKML